jgi:AraC-like DNA-binding protein
MPNDGPGIRIVHLNGVPFNVGFGSKSTFNEMFKKFTGENPSGCRERHLVRRGHLTHNGREL